jgi:hypothetical protein
LDLELTSVTTVCHTDACHRDTGRMMIDFWTAAQAVGLVALLPILLIGAYKAGRYLYLWRTAPLRVGWGQRAYAVLFSAVVALAVLAGLVVLTYNILLSI